MEADEQSIRELHTCWIEAVNAGNLARLLSLMADDAVFLSPGQAPCGRDGFPAGFLAAHQGYLIHCTSELDEVVIAGDFAYARSRDALSMVARVGGEALALAGHRITVYRKTPDDRWLLARDAHTLSSAVG